MLRGLLPAAHRGDSGCGQTDALLGVRGGDQVVGVGLRIAGRVTRRPSRSIADHGAQRADRGQAPQVAGTRPVQARQAQSQEDVRHPHRAGVKAGDEEGDKGHIAVGQRGVGAHAHEVQDLGEAESDEWAGHGHTGRQEEQVAGPPAQEGQRQGEPGGVVAQDGAHRRAEEVQARGQHQQERRAREDA